MVWKIWEDENVTNYDVISEQMDRVKKGEIQNQLYLTASSISYYEYSCEPHK